MWIMICLFAPVFIGIALVIGYASGPDYDLF